MWWADGSSNRFPSCLDTFANALRRLRSKGFRKCCPCNYFIPKHVKRELDKSSPALHDALEHLKSTYGSINRQILSITIFFPLFYKTVVSIQCWSAYSLGRCHLESSTIIIIVSFLTISCSPTSRHSSSVTGLMLLTVFICSFVSNYHWC